MNYHKVYMNQISSSSLMGQVSQLWRNQLLCDAVIKTGNVDTKAHRLVLVAACPMLQHMENATVGSNLEVRLASNIKQESVTSFLQYLYEGFMMLTEDNFKDVEKIGKLLQVESVIKCCIDFEKCLTRKTGMPESISTRYTLKENEDSLHVRTTELLKVQDVEKRSMSDSNFSTPESKRQKTLTTPPPPLLLPMLNLTQHGGDRVSMRRDFIQDPGVIDSTAANSTAVPQISPLINSQNARQLDIVQDGLEIIHREAADPNQPASQSTQVIQQAMGISVASQKVENPNPQVVNVAENLPPKRTSISTILSSPRLHVPSSDPSPVTNLTVPSALPVQERRVSTGSIPTDNIPKTVDWAQNKTIESRRQFIHPSSGPAVPPQGENFHQRLTEFYATHLQQQRQQALQRMSIPPPTQNEDTIPYCQSFPMPMAHSSPRHPFTPQSTSPATPPASGVRQKLQRLQPKLNQQASAPDTTGAPASQGLFKRTNDLDRSVIEANMSQLLAASRAVSPPGSIPSRPSSREVTSAIQGGSAETKPCLDSKLGDESVSKSSEVSEDSQYDLASVKTEDMGDSELRIDIPDPGGETEDPPGMAKMEEPIDDGSSTNSDHGGALWADNSQRAHAVHDVYHLWEFIRDLLHDPKYCPRIIKWENAEEGVFRVVDSQEVASLWGKTKKSTKMTYEYMSRSLRYCRTLGYFADLPKNAGYPKKLCFKFGPKAYNWKPKDSPKLDEPMNLVTRKGDTGSDVW